MGHCPDMSEYEQRAARYEAELRAEGVRITRQRRALLRVLAEANDHPDANELYRRVVTRDRSVALSTVYRTLAILENRGVIHRLEFDDGRARFEHADRQHHDHLIDMETGQVIEFRSEAIERLQAEIAAELGYKIIRHKLQLYGMKRS
jgi:Fur family transcriptional regulator, ferric uptake regulator